jgi:hypothetical protein
MRPAGAPPYTTMAPTPYELRWRQKVLSLCAVFLQMIGIAAVLYQSPGYWTQPYHTSALSGQAWVDELIQGHPDRIYNELGMRLHVFLAFVANLRALGGLETSKKGVSVEEQAAIFLYACVTGLSVRHLGERFQRSNETISKYVPSPGLSIVLIVVVDISARSWMWFRASHSTQHMCSYRLRRHHWPVSSKTTPSFFHSSRMCLGP